MTNCAIIGATGYTGIELIKILLNHPSVQITGLTTRQKEAIPLRRLVPSVPKNTALEVRPYSFQEIKQSSDAVFLCLPHTEAMETAAKFLAAGKVVVDLSADFRLRDWKVYEKWYGVKHTARELISKSVYGLTEFFREKIKKANLISNPGCYPTGSALGIYPLLQKKAIDPESIIIDAKSGVSGAGKKLNASTQYCEVDENFYAYKVGRHQHTPEIEQTLSIAAGKQVKVTFVPHLLPLERGILSTIHLKRKKGVLPARVEEIFREAYADQPFVRVRPAGEFPALKDVQRTNYCDIGLWADPSSDRLIVITAIDNLLKGASGQAVQNMNVRFGYPEEEGLQAW